MGNYRFKLSDMIPNAWFYKLKDMAKTKNLSTKNNKQHHLSSTSSSSSPNSTFPSKLSKQPHHHHHNSPYPRKSYYFTRELTNPSSDDPKLFTTSSPIPRKSFKQRTTRHHPHKPVSSTVSAKCGCRATATTECLPDYSASSSDPEHSDMALTDDSFDDILSWSQSTSSRNSNFNNDIVIEVDNKSLTTKEIPALDKVLPPIITSTNKKQAVKPARTSGGQLRSPGISSGKRQYSVNSPGGVRLRVNSPRIGHNRRVQGRKSVSRKSLSESLAIVKASFDPQRDFRESMVEMIVENNIRASKDLEDLLACYLSLNSDEYHHLIINVFKQIWFDFTLPAKLQ